MPWPTPQDYNEAIQNPRFSFSDPDLACGRPEVTALGLPRPITGNFASVYRMHCAGKDWAVRCFWRDYADMSQRYAAISHHLSTSHLPYTVGFEYLPQGIQIRGQWYPILKMEWVQGELLNEYIERNLTSPVALTDLARRWLAMADALESVSSAHGDLQHGNVLVVNGQLKLVDYDAMYVPALRGRGSHEIGHQNYQHPRRSSAHFGPGLDRFSSWVIYTSLVALSVEPALWQQTRGGDECLLFRKADFSNGGTSGTLGLLARHSNQQLRDLGAQLSTCVTHGPMELPVLQSMDTADTTPSRSHFAARRVFPRYVSAPQAQTQAITPASVATVPAWLEEHVNAQRDAERARFSAAPSGARLCPVASGAILLLVGATTAFSTAPILPITTLVGLLLLVVNAAVLFIAYRRDPTVRRTLALVKQEKAQRRTLTGLQRQAHGRLRARERSVAAFDKQEQRVRKLRTELEATERKELAEARTMRDSRVSACAVRLREIDVLEKAELDRLLQDLQARHVRLHLRSSSLRDAELQRIAWPARVRLWTAGVRNAADLTSERMRAIQWLGEKSLLVLATWRVEKERDARRTMPRSLEAARSSKARLPFEQDRGRVNAERDRVVRDEKEIAFTIHERYARRYRSLDARLLSARQRNDEQCKAIERELTAIVQSQILESGKLASIQRQLERFEGITFRHFLVHVLLSGGSERITDHS